MAAAVLASVVVVSTLITLPTGVTAAGAASATTAPGSSMPRVGRWCCWVSTWPASRTCT